MNDEILKRYFTGASFNEEAVRAAGRDIAGLLLPSRERALLLNHAYRALVREQRFELGRDALLSPPSNVHAEIRDEETENGKTGRVFTDGRLWLEWNR